MADTKVSGLTAAGSFLTTQEFPANDSGTSKKVTGTQIKAVFPWGSLGYAQVVASQGTFTAATDLTSLTVTVTVGSGRRIKVSAQAFFQSSVADDLVIMTIQEGATVLQSTQMLCRPAGQATSVVGIVILTPSAGSHTYKLTAARAAGTGNITMTAASTLPAFILAEDIGT